MIPKFAILKSFSPQAGGGDSEWYLGTADHSPVFGRPPTKPALFDTEADAERRMKGIEIEKGRELKVKELLFKEGEL